MRALKNKNGRLLIALVATLAFTFISGCGGSSRNDQGTSMTFLGWYQSAPTSATSNAPGLSGAYMNIAASVDEGSSGIGSIGGEVLGFAAFTNHLGGQTVRMQRVFHTYYVPGGTTNIPDTSVASPAVLGPAEINEGNQDLGENSSLPPSANAIAETQYVQIPIVPASTREFIALNRNNFPEPPFVLVVTSYGSGVTSAGIRIDSNPVEFEVTVLPEVIITPPEGVDPSASATPAGVETGDESVEVVD